VLDDLFRGAAEPAIPLGHEPVRYYEFAAADAAEPPAAVNTELVGPGGTLFSAPQLPQAPAGADGTNVHLMIRIMLEDIALSPLSETLNQGNRFTVLSDLDRLPVSARAEWGRLLMDMLRDVPQVPDEHCKWRFRRMLDEDGTRQLIVGAATRFDPVIQASFSAYIQLRHHEVTSRTGRTEDSSTLGVLLTPPPRREAPVGHQHGASPRRPRIVRGGTAGLPRWVEPRSRRGHCQRGRLSAGRLRQRPEGPVACPSPPARTARPGSRPRCRVARR
jgi:hypothetical protein